jgi:P-aminobenzoate N-oxygenase AurF
MALTHEKLDADCSLDGSMPDAADRDDRFTTMVARLSKLSVDKHFDAFVDVPWDDPEMAIDPSDSRWELSELDPLGRSEWYRSQPGGVRSRIGLQRVAQMLHTGWQFENILQVGLLIHVMNLQNDSTEFRYLHHEIAEESQRSMMFHEFVRRSAMAPTGMPKGSNLVVRPFLMMASRRNPMLLCIAALAGEEPADFLQREHLRLGYPHPLMERIARVHVTEEARHIAFARHYLRRSLPRLPRRGNAWMSLLFPVFMWVGARLMVRPGSAFRKANGIPRDVLRKVNSSLEARVLFAGSVQKVRDLADELKLMNPVARLAWSMLFGPCVD